MNSKLNLTLCALLVLLTACASTATITDLCPGPIETPGKAQEIVGILCDHEWEEGTSERVFCRWIDAVDLQQEELKLYHKYRLKMEE